MKLINYVRFGAVAVVLPLAACNPNPVNPMAATVPMPMPANVAVSAQDQNFAMQAAMSDMYEVQSSQMALQQSRNPRVQAYAQHMIDDHTKTTQMMMAALPSKGIAAPTAMDPAQQQMIARLQPLSGRTFDAFYKRQQVSSHRDALQVNQAEASSGTDPDMKAMARQNVPMIEDHMRMAQRLP